MNKNILCVSVMQSWGGGEEFLLNLYGNVKEYNFFIVSPEGKPNQIFKENGIKTYTINSLRKIYRNSEKWNAGSKLKIILNIIKSTFSFVKIIQTNNINIILANGNFAGLYVFISKIITRKKLVVVQHLIYNKNSVEGKIISILNKYSDKLICVSNAVAENIRNHLNNKSNDNLIVIHNGINIPENIKADLSNDIRIGMVGSIIKIKGIGLVLDALKDILVQKPNIKFYIYGDVTSENDSVNYESRLNKFIELNNIGDKVFFCGHEEEKDKLYNNLDIIINFTTISEAFPLSILEAMSYKKIVITQNEGGPKEIIEDNLNGFLIEKGDKNQLKEKINYCLENFYSIEFDEIRNNARKTIKNNYGLNIFSAKYKELFDKLIIK